jgi:hypothetical protein
MRAHARRGCERARTLRHGRHGGYSGAARWGLPRGAPFLPCNCTNKRGASEQPKRARLCPPAEGAGMPPPKACSPAVRSHAGNHAAWVRGACARARAGAASKLRGTCARRRARTTRRRRCRLQRCAGRAPGAAAPHALRCDGGGRHVRRNWRRRGLDAARAVGGGVRRRTSAAQAPTARCVWRRIAAAMHACSPHCEAHVGTPSGV